MTYSKIIGTGSYLPKKILTNADLEKMVDTTDEWIVERSGIKSRHILADDETSASMGTVAAKRALEAAQTSVNEVDLILSASCSPDRIFPSTACLLQDALDIKNPIPAFDIVAACAGFIYGLSIADQYIRSGQMKTVLVVGTEAMSRIIDWKDRGVCVLFGDGAGAVVLQASEQPGIHSTHLHAQGQYKDLLYLPNDLAAPSLKTDSPYVQMEGHDVFKLAVKTMGDIVSETLSKNNIDKSDIDWLVPHQANLRIIKAIAKKLSLSMDRVIMTIDKHGNTSSASIPLALDEAISEGKIKRGDKLLLEAFGGGMAWGSALVTY